MKIAKKVKIVTFDKIFFFLYLCSICAHQTSSVFDTIFEYVSFFLWIGFSIAATKKMKVELTKISLWYGFFLCFSLLSFVWAKYDSNQVFFYWKKIFQLFAVVTMLSNVIKTKEELIDYIQIVLYALIYSAIIIIIRTPFGSWGTERVGEVIGVDKNIVGTRSAVGIIIALYFFLLRKEKKCLIFMAPLFLMVMMSGSKKAIIMLLLGLTLFPLMDVKKNEVGKFLFRLIVIGIVLGGIWYAIFNVEIFYKVLGSRIKRTLTYYISGRTTMDYSTSEREYYISVAKQLFTDNPILGVGLDNFKAYIRKIGYNEGAYSHNNYWEMLSCLGIVGFCVFYSFHAYLINAYIKIFRKKKERLCITLLIIFLLYLICDYANVSYINIFQYILICFGFIYIKVEKENERRGRIT